MPSAKITKAGDAARIGGLPGLVVVFALAALLVLPIPLRQESSSLRAQLDLYADPAADQIAEIQYLLARQSSSLRGYLISGDSTYLLNYRQHAEAERRIYPVLEANAARLTPELAADVAELQTLSSQWRGRLEEGVDDELDALSDLEPELYLGSIEAAGRAMQSVRQLMRERQAEIQQVERRMQTLYVLLFLTAASALFAVVLLNSRVRQLAKEADLRRAEIERAMRETERAVAARADLIRGFTHDVKNPLGVADGFAELLEMGLRGNLTEDQSATVQRIRGAIRGAIEIINELLDLSRLEGGGLQVNRREVDLNALVDDLVEGYVRAAESLGHEIVYDGVAADHDAVLVFTDADRVRQILQNLVSNAIKYTAPPGQIRVRLEVLRRSAHRDGAWATVLVADNGAGIPKEEQERIFNEFHRVPGSQGSGHGLGLAISRRIARLLGGDVTVESVLGQGSRFLLWLPLREVDSEGAHPPAAQAARRGTSRKRVEIDEAQ